LGDGVSGANDVFLDVYPGANLELNAGYVVYNNVGSSPNSNAKEEPSSESGASVGISSGASAGIELFSGSSLIQ
jgi:hypothetical protein